ncbi:MAG: manganese efflux pump [Prevotella sp.]|nr:manganese efflux pump [Prevotella sp.]MBR7030897.1 manganese efflux pump [Prevotella sp.]
MNLLDIILLAVALAMDCFTVSIVSGIILTQRDGSFVTPTDVTKEPSLCVIRMAFLFGFFQALMPLLGWLGISHFQSYMEAYDHWIAFGLLGLIGGKMIWESFSPEEEHHFNPCRLRTQLLLAVATSIDALAVGISFACTGYTALSQLTLPLLLIGLVSFLFSIIGYHLGRCFGKTIIRRLNPELIGGTILILIGVKVLMSHLLQ